MFIGRQQELATLNRLYASDKFEFAVIYGRRRVGKTALISHLSKINRLSISWALKAMQNKILITSAIISWNLLPALI